MIARGWATGLALLLLVAPAALGQDTTLRPPKGVAEDPARVILSRRLELVEKQLAALTKEVAELRKRPRPPAAPEPMKAEVRIFPLRNAEAAEVAKTLKELFQGHGTSSIRIALHPSTNSLVVRGGGADLETVEAVIVKLDDLSAGAKKGKAAGKR
jgi:type II secretory pathway component GspD/PulD (secretin)